MGRPDETAPRPEIEAAMAVLDRAGWASDVDADVRSCLDSGMPADADDAAWEPAADEHRAAGLAMLRAAGWSEDRADAMWDWMHDEAEAAIALAIDGVL
jgi:hypothetical protein